MHAGKAVAAVTIGGLLILLVVFLAHESRAAIRYDDDEEEVAPVKLDPVESRMQERANIKAIMEVEKGTAIEECQKPTSQSSVQSAPRSS